MPSTHELGLGLERGIDRLDDPLDVQEAALGDRGDGRPLLGQIAAREVDARDLEERDSLGARVDVAAGGLDEARQERGAERGELDRDRLREPPRRVVVGAEARGVDLGEAEPGEDVLDPAAQLLLAGQRALHLTAGGERERHVLEPEAGDLLDDVDLAGRVAGAPGRGDHVRSVVLVAEPLEEPVLARRAASRSR